MNGFGATTMSVSTSMMTPPGSYQLTVTGTSGGIVQRTIVTLVVGLPFLPSLR